MSEQPFTGRSPGHSRILLDLAEGRLDDDELEAIAAWLAVDAEVPPPQVIERGIRARTSALATA